MKIVIKEKLKTFKLLMGMLKKIGMESKMIFDETGLTMMVSSGGNAAAKLQFVKEFFDVYEIQGGKEEFGVFISDIANPMKFATTELTMEHIDDRMVFTTGKDKFKTPILMEVEGFDRMPELTFDFSAKITPSQISDAINKLNLVGHDAIKFYTEDRKLKMKSTLGVKEVEVEIGDCDSYDGKCLISSIYIGYVAGSSTDEMTIHIKEENPMKIEYSKDGAYFEYVIAPRVGDY